MKRLLLAAAVPMMLAACAGGQRIAADDLAAAAQALGAAEGLALLYTSLPRCTSPKAGPLCSDQAVVDRIKLYATRAHNALLFAERNQALLGAAVTAIEDFGAVIPQHRS